MKGWGFVKYDCEILYSECHFWDGAVRGGVGVVVYRN